MSNVNNLFHLMKERNISKATLSKDTGISTGNLSDWSNGRCLPSADKLCLLADHLDCSVDYLLGREDLSSSDEGITLYNKLDAEDKAEVRGTMKQMLKSVKYNQDTIPTVPYGELAALGGIENPQPPRKKRETT